MTSNKIDYKDAIKDLQKAEKEKAGYIVAVQTENPTVSIDGLSSLQVANTVLTIFDRHPAVKLIVLMHLLKGGDNV